MQVLYLRAFFITLNDAAARVNNGNEGVEGFTILLLQKDLSNKYQTIFHMYLKDLAAVQQLYEAGKTDPPRPRDVPLVAGCIMWARHLQRRIEGPMQQYASSNTLLKIPLLATPVP